MGNSYPENVFPWRVGSYCNFSLKHQSIDYATANQTRLENIGKSARVPWLAEKCRYFSTSIDVGLSWIVHTFPLHWSIFIHISYWSFWRIWKPVMEGSMTRSLLGFHQAAWLCRRRVSAAVAATKPICIWLWSIKMHGFSPQRPDTNIEIEDTTPR